MAQRITQRIVQRIMWTCFIVSTLAHSVAQAEVLFEGYSKIQSNGAAIGYIVNRYEFDKGKKEFVATSFTRLNPKAGNTTESLKAACNDKFEPKSFFYTLKSDELTKTIDAKFEKNFMKLTIFDGKKTVKSQVAVKKGVFLSSFLGYLMLQNGYKVGKRFVYQAIAEEEGTVESGISTIKSEEKFRDKPVFRITNAFKTSDPKKKVEFSSIVTPRGEILATESPAQSLSTELVADASVATKGEVVPTSTLVLLFGKVPEGTANILAQEARLKAGAAAAAPAAAAPSAPAVGTPATTTPGQLAAPSAAPAPAAKSAQKSG